MFKSKVLTSLTLFIAAAAFTSTLGFAKVAHAADNDDVFMDEGDGDFDAPPVAAPPAAKKEVKVEKAPAPRPAAPPVEAKEEVPTLTDDAAPTIVPPTEDPSAPAAAAPKEKKASKKKSEKKASKTASAPVATGGSFVTTKEACPMMRTPASTGETMFTVKASKKIWVEDAGDGWVKGFNKAGEPGYLSKECLQ